MKTNKNISSFFSSSSQSCLLFFFFSSLILFNSCDNSESIFEPIGPKEDPCLKYYKSMPEVTTSGENTFGCIVNDEEWVAYTDPIGQLLDGAVSLDIGFNENVNHLVITARRRINKEECTESDETLIMHVSNIDENQPNAISVYTVMLYRLTEYRYDLDVLADNSLDILKLDMNKNLISGMFNMTLISEECNDKLVIEDGRFDAYYEYQ